MRKIRVLVVDDSATIRKILGDAIAACPDLELCGTAANGQVALDKLDAAQPDVVTLDLEMPVLDGIGALRGLRARRPKLPVLMFSSHTERGAIATLDALAAGASDFVAKPRVESAADGQAFVAREVLPRLRALAGRHAEVRPGAVPAPAAAPASNPPPHPASGPAGGRVDAIVIAVSTGGPVALAVLLPKLPRTLAVPVLLVQHMPALFTRILAERLSATGPLPVVEGKDGERVVAGRVYLAPGGQHLVVERRATGPVLRIDDGPPENSCKPAADPLFRSAAAVWGSGTLGVVMTGMGRDGCAGAALIRQAGGTVLAQDKESSVVWGMPGSVVEAGLADAVVPLGRLADEMLARVARGRHAAAAR